MTAPGTDERLHRDVLEPLLRTALGLESNGDQRVYDFGKVPGSDGRPGRLPNIYALLTVERASIPVTKAAGRAHRSSWRIVVTYVGRTVDEARWAAQEATAAIEGLRLTVGAHTSTPVTHERTWGIRPDDGRHSGRTMWTYSL